MSTAAGKYSFLVPPPAFSGGVGGGAHWSSLSPSAPAFTLPPRASGLRADAPVYTPAVIATVRNDPAHEAPAPAQRQGVFLEGPCSSASIEVLCKALESISKVLLDTANNDEIELVGKDQDLLYSVMGNIQMVLHKTEKGPLINNSDKSQEVLHDQSPESKSDGVKQIANHASLNAKGDVHKNFNVSGSVSSAKPEIITQNKGLIKDVSRNSHLEAARPQYAGPEFHISTPSSSNAKNAAKRKEHATIAEPGDEHILPITRGFSSIHGSIDPVEHNPDVLLYKNLWIEAELANCEMKYQLQYARMKDMREAFPLCSGALGTCA